MKKHRYTTYPFLLHKVRKLYGKEAGKKITDAEALRVIARTQPERFLRIEAAFLAEEYHWRNLSPRPVIFPESAEVIDRIRKTKYNVSMAEAIEPPFESFMLCFPQGYKIEGLQVPACLITDMGHEDRKSKVFLPMLKKVYNKPPEFAQDNSESFIAVNFCHKADTPTRVCIPRHLLGQAVACNSPEELTELLGVLDGSERTINQKEETLQFHLIKLICSIYVYIQATGDALTEGFPAENRPNIEGGSFQRATDFTLKTQSNRQQDKPNDHYRSGHFRQLTHSRFYQGEHINKPVGSRIVWVKDTFVGRGVDPHTLKKDK